jgi:hypothetical protein
MKKSVGPTCEQPQPASRAKGKTMTDMPPKIWASIEYTDDFSKSGYWSTDRDIDCLDSETCYVPLDLVEPKICEIERRSRLRIAELTKALQSICEVPFDKPANFHASDEDWLKRRAQMMQNAARIALNP